MPKYRWITGVCVVLMLGASTASAQDASAAGLTLSSNAIGIHVPAGDRAAIRPTLGFSRNTSDYEGSQFIEDSITTTTLVPGVAVLLYLKSWDDTRLYVSPQYTYSRLSSNIDGDEPRNAHSGAFMVGAQHGLGARFGLFAEGGLGWTRSKSTSPGNTLPASVTTTTWGTRATVGGILFF